MADTIEKYRTRITPDWQLAIDAYQVLQVPITSAYFAVSFAYADIPVGKQFDSALPAGQPSRAISTVAVLLAILHEWVALPVPSTARGHRSICIIDFPNGMPRLIRDIPLVTSFVERTSEENIWLTSHETLAALRYNDSSRVVNQGP